MQGEVCEGKGTLILKGQILLYSALAYMCLPTVLFLCGWLTPWIALPTVVIVVTGIFGCARSLKVPDLYLYKRQFIAFFGLLFLCFLWVMSIGLTGHTLQHSDMELRMPLYQTLISCDWPLINEYGQPVIYYLAYWLPPALLCKITGFQDPLTTGWILALWVLCGTWLTFTLLWVKWRKVTWLFIIMLIFQGSPKVLFLLESIPGWPWSEHLFNYIDSLFFSGVSAMQQLNNTFNHIGLIWLFMALWICCEIPPKYQLFLASLCLLVSPLGSIGILILLICNAILQRIPLQEYFATRYLIPACLLALFAGIYFSATSSANGLCMTWQKHPLIGGMGHFWLVLSISLVLQIGLPALLLYRPFKHNPYLWTALIILFLSHFIFIGGAGHLNELIFKASGVSYFCLAILFTQVFVQKIGTRLWRILCLGYLILISTNAFYVMQYALPSLTWDRQNRIDNMQLQWNGHLHHPESAKLYSHLWGKADHTHYSMLYLTQAGESATFCLKPFSTGVTTLTQPRPPITPKEHKKKNRLREILGF